MSRTLSLLPAVLVCLAVCASGQEPAPEEAPDLWVKIQAVKGTGLSEDGKQQIPAELEAVQADIGKLGYARYERLTRGAVSSAKPGVALSFKNLPLELEIDATCVRAPKKPGRLRLVLTLTKPGKEPKTRVKVARMVVEIDDGDRYVVQRIKAFSDGDLILVVTASGRELKPDS